MNLPWGDVFTTNYDTLLERAAKNIINKKYDVVYKSDNLPHSEAPRIIKLHGSFPPKETPLIITEEDYRTYPEKYSPFVNTVQQAIMENSMCLIGFSGTDPNFNQWIGWVKDKLKEARNPIYLIGFLNIPEPERKVLEKKKKIVLVDLKEWDDCKTLNYSEGLKKLFEFLGDNSFSFSRSEQISSESKVKLRHINWPKKESLDFYAPSLKNDNDNVIKTINFWHEQRKNYPNWLYLSWNRRSNLQIFTEQWINNISYLKTLPDNWDIRGLYELNWRIEKCLLPIPNNLINDYDSILNKYDFYRSSNEKNDDELKKIWLELSFAVLRWSRETLDYKIWERYEKKIKESIGNNSYYENQLYYEQVYYAMAKLDLKKVKSLIQQWDSIAKPLIWKVKYASIIAELGEVEKARQLWKETLEELRPMILKSRIKNDFYYLGVEGCIILNLSIAEQYLQDFNDDPFRKKQENAISQVENIQKRYQNQLQELEQYDCSPWDNIERFSLVFKSSESLENNTHIYREFDKVKTSYVIGKSVNQEVIHACQVLRFFEEAGIALRVGNVNIANKTLRQSLPRMANIYSRWVFCILNRIGINDEKYLELCFSQRKIYQVNAHDINEILDFYIKQFKYIIDNKLNSFDPFKNNFYKTLVKNLYDVISRLTVKASSENLQKIFDLGVLLYKIKSRQKIFLFSNKIEVFFKRLYEAMTPELIFNNLNTILGIKFDYPEESKELPPPLPKDWREFKSTPEECPKDLKNTIDLIIKYFDNSNFVYRDQFSEYIEVCKSINILSEDQKNKIDQILYKYNSNQDNIQWDKDYTFESLNREELKSKQDYINNYDFNEDFVTVVGDQNGRGLRRSFFLEQANHLYNEYSFFQTNNDIDSQLNTEENIKLYLLLKKKWNNQKQDIIQFLNSVNKKNDYFSKNINEILHKPFICLDFMLGEIIIPRLEDHEIICDVKVFIKEIEVYFDLPRASVAYLIPQFRSNEKLNINIYDNCLSKFITAFSSFDYQKFDSYAYALFNAYRFANKKMLPEPPEILLNTLINAIGMKSDPCFKSACSIVGSIFSFYEPDKTMCEMLLIYLKELEEQTDFNSTSNRFVLSDRYDYRQAAMFLAAKLYYVYKRKNEPIPAVLDEWKQIGQSNEEFPSVRNTWLREQYQNM